MAKMISPYLGSYKVTQPFGVNGHRGIDLTVGVDGLGTDDDIIAINLPEIMYDTDYIGKYTKNICIEYNQPRYLPRETCAV